MYDKVRGDIKHKNRYKQLISYEGLERHRKITPTDIDGLIDYNGNAFIILECKLYDKELEAGQKMAIENLVNALEKAGKAACCLIFRHNKSPDEIIMAKDCLVTDMYFENTWYQLKENLLKFINDFEIHCRKEKIQL